METNITRSAPWDLPLLGSLGGAMQTKSQSLQESIFGTIIGLLVAVISNLLVLPWFGYPVNFGDSIGIALAFTAISILRGYLVRRLFNHLHR